MAGLRKLPIEANSDYEMDETDDTELTPGLAQIAQQQDVYASAKNKLAQPRLETHRAETVLDVIREKTEQADADNKAKLEELTRVEDDIKAKLEERERVEAETKVKLEGNERVAAVVKALQAERDALRGEGNAPQVENENPSLGQQVTEMQYETGTTKHILNKDYGAQSHHTSITINVTGAHVVGHNAGGLSVHDQTVAPKPPMYYNVCLSSRCPGRQCKLVHDNQRVLYRNLIPTLPYQAKKISAMRKPKFRNICLRGENCAGGCDFVHAHQLAHFGKEIDSLDDYVPVKKRKVNVN